VLQQFCDARYTNVYGGRQLSEEEIAGLLIAVLFAGQHTSSITSSWTGYFMINDKVQHTAARGSARVCVCGWVGGCVRARVCECVCAAAAASRCVLWQRPALLPLTPLPARRPPRRVRAGRVVRGRR
jgi:cytochrome P450